MMWHVTCHMPHHGKALMAELLDSTRKIPHESFRDKVRSRAHQIKQADLKDSVHSMIKEMILDQDLKPGDQLPVEALALEMKVSRTPVREALLRLENEGLVRAVSRVGFFVQGISKQDLHELFELREITEGYAAGKSALRMSEKDVELAVELHSI